MQICPLTGSVRFPSSENYPGKFVGLVVQTSKSVHTGSYLPGKLINRPLPHKYRKSSTANFPFFVVFISPTWSKRAFMNLYARDCECVSARAPHNYIQVDASTVKVLRAKYKTAVFLLWFENSIST